MTVVVSKDYIIVPIKPGPIRTIPANRGHNAFPKLTYIKLPEKQGSGGYSQTYSSPLWIKNPYCEEPMKQEIVCTVSFLAVKQIIMDYLGIFKDIEIICDKDWKIIYDKKDLQVGISSERVIYLSRENVNKIITEECREILKLEPLTAVRTYYHGDLIIVTFETNP